jgi:hypothetical protein
VTLLKKSVSQTLVNSHGSLDSKICSLMDSIRLFLYRKAEAPCTGKKEVHFFLGAYDPEPLGDAARHIEKDNLKKQVKINAI